MNILYIYNNFQDSNFEPGNENKIYSYYLDVGKMTSQNVTNLNNQQRFNDLALELRDNYCEYIYSLNKLFIDAGLIFEKKLSLYFLTDLSNKRTELFNTYPSICHLNLIQERVKFINIDKIILDGCEKNFIEMLSSVFKGKEIEIRNTPMPQKAQNNFWAQAKFLIKTFVEIIFLRLYRFSAPKVKTINKLFLTRYPLHFHAVNREEKYGELVGEDDYFLISIITDGSHQNLKFNRYVSALTGLRSFPAKFLILDDWLSIVDVIGTFFKLFPLSIKYSKLLRRRYCFRNMDITGFIHFELKQSLPRIPRLLMFKKAIRKVFSDYIVGDFYYYLHEYCYGRFFTYILQTYFPRVNKIGFQHGPASRRKLLYYLAENELDSGQNDFINHLPIPDKVLAEDEQSKRVYEEAGYKNVRIMDRIYRLSYLENINRENVISNTVLVACGLHDGELLLNALSNEMLNTSDKTYYFKLHPRAHNSNTIDIIKGLNAENLKIAEKDLTYYLSIVDEVIVTYSSVGYEAHLLGIPVRIIDIPGKINESPLQI